MLFEQHENCLTLGDEDGDGLQIVWTQIVTVLLDMMHLET